MTKAPEKYSGAFVLHVAPHLSTMSRLRTVVRAKGLEPLRRLRHWNLNPARLPIPPRPLIRCGGPRNKLSPFTTNCLIESFGGCQAQVATQFVDVALGSYVVLCDVDVAIFIHHNGRTDQPFVDPSV